MNRKKAVGLLAVLAVGCADDLPGGRSNNRPHDMASPSPRDMATLSSVDMAAPSTADGATNPVDMAIAPPADLATIPPPDMALPPAFALDPYQKFQVTGDATAVTTGDFNHDGLTDVAVAVSENWNPGHHVAIFLQNAQGKLQPPTKYPILGGSAHTTSSIAAGDLNGDGLTDIAVNAANGTLIFFQNLQGTLDPARFVSSAHQSFTNTYKVRIGDVNSDDRVDLVTLDWGTQSDDVDVHLQNQMGRLNAPVIYLVTHGGYDDVRIGDVNHDNRLDIVVMSGQQYSIPNLGILLQNNAGSFGSPVHYSLNIQQPENTHAVAVGDVKNGDGRTDVVVTYGGNSPYANIGIFAQNAQDTLDPSTSRSSYDIPAAVAIADMNGDTLADIVVLHDGWYKIGVYLQDGFGGLLPELLFPNTYGSSNPDALALGDVNGDGKTDVLTVDVQSKSLAVHYNH